MVPVFSPLTIDLIQVSWPTRIKAMSSKTSPISSKGLHKLAPLGSERSLPPWFLNHCVKLWEEIKKEQISLRLHDSITLMQNGGPWKSEPGRWEMESALYENLHQHLISAIGQQEKVAFGSSRFNYSAAMLEIPVAIFAPSFLEAIVQRFAIDTQADLVTLNMDDLEDFADDIIAPGLAISRTLGGLKPLEAHSISPQHVLLPPPSSLPSPIEFRPRLAWHRPLPPISDQQTYSNEKIASRLVGRSSSDDGLSFCNTLKRQSYWRRKWQRKSTETKKSTNEEESSKHIRDWSMMDNDTTSAPGSAASNSDTELPTVDEWVVRVNHRKEKISARMLSKPNRSKICGNIISQRNDGSSLNAGSSSDKYLSDMPRDKDRTTQTETNMPKAENMTKQKRPNLSVSVFELYGGSQDDRTSVLTSGSEDATQVGPGNKGVPLDQSQELMDPEHEFSDDKPKKTTVTSKSQEVKVLRDKVTRKKSHTSLEGSQQIRSDFGLKKPDMPTKLGGFHDYVESPNDLISGPYLDSDSPTGGTEAEIAENSKHVPKISERCPLLAKVKTDEYGSRIKPSHLKASSGKLPENNKDKVTDNDSLGTLSPQTRDPWPKTPICRGDFYLHILRAAATKRKNMKVANGEEELETPPLEFYSDFSNFGNMLIVHLTQAYAFTDIAIVDLTTIAHLLVAENPSLHGRILVIASDSRHPGVHAEYADLTLSSPSVLAHPPNAASSRKLPGTPLFQPRLPPQKKVRTPSKTQNYDPSIIIKKFHHQALGSAISVVPMDSKETSKLIENDFVSYRMRGNTHKLRRAIVGNNLYFPYNLRPEFLEPKASWSFDEKSKASALMREWKLNNNACEALARSMKTISTEANCSDVMKHYEHILSKHWYGIVAVESWIVPGRRKPPYLQESSFASGSQVITSTRYLGKPGKQSWLGQKPLEERFEGFPRVCEAIKKLEEDVHKNERELKLFDLIVNPGMFQLQSTLIYLFFFDFTLGTTFPEFSEGIFGMNEK